jgi:PII-like signaling protein
MRIDAWAKRLTILVDETDQWNDRPLHVEIVHRAREAGLAGASVLRGIEGYGASSHIHTGRLLSLADDLPIAITIVDS